MALYVTISNGPLLGEDFVLPVPAIPDSTMLEVLVPKGGFLLPGDTVGVSLNHKLHPLSGQFPGIRGKESPSGQGLPTLTTGRI